MKALRGHFEGEGNASRKKNEADRLKESLHSQLVLGNTYPKT